MKLALTSNSQNTFGANPSDLSKLKAQCYKDFYGLVGEYCVECWFFKEESGRSKVESKMYAASCSAEWKTYDRGPNITKSGHEEPKANQGFAILPPFACEDGKCRQCSFRRDDGPVCQASGLYPTKIPKDGEVILQVDANPPNLGGELIPRECVNTDDKTCEDSLMIDSQESCHPNRFNGTVIDDFDAEHSFTSARLLCPYIMPCAPPDSCGGGGRCTGFKKGTTEPLCEEGEACDMCLKDKPTKMVNGIEIEVSCQEVGNLDPDEGFLQPNSGMYTHVDANGKEIKGKPFTIASKNIDDIGFNVDDNEASGYCYCDMLDPHLYASDVTKYQDYEWGNIAKKDFPAYVDVYLPFINNDVSASNLETDPEICSHLLDWEVGQEGCRIKACNEVHLTLGDKSCFAPRCGQCNPKSHFRLDGICEPCPECPICLIAAMLGVGITASVAMYFLTKEGVDLVIMSIGIDYFQVVSLFAKSKVAWPPEMKELLKYLQWFQLDIDLAAPECLARGLFTFEMKWYLKISFPFIGGALVLLMMMVQAAFRAKDAFIRKMKGVKEEEDVYRVPMWSIVVSMTVSMIYFLYLSITRAAFDIFNCVETTPPTGKVYMASQPLEECGRKGGLQMRLLNPAIATVILYCCGFPISIFTTFRHFRATIARDQYLRAHQRGNHHTTNPDFTFRKAMSKLYYAYRPRYWWWFMHIILRKFFLVVNSIIFRDNATFQMAISLGMLFVSFCLHITFWPFLGMKERANIIKEEAEETIFVEVQKLEKASKIAKINGKAYYDIIHKQRQQMDIQTEFIHTHVFSLFNYNVIEAIFVGISVLINLAGIMFDSPYLGKEADGSPNRAASVLAYITVGSIIASIIYFIIIFGNEVMSVGKKKAMKGQILWHKVKRQYMRKILHMAKDRDRTSRRLLFLLLYDFTSL